MVLMVKNSMAQLIGVTLFQFIISIVDPSILTQPLPSGEPSSFQAGTVTTVGATAGEQVALGATLFVVAGEESDD